jgi:hypothetical protein
MGLNCQDGDIIIFFTHPVDLSTGSVEITGIDPDHAGILGNLKTKAGKNLLHAGAGYESSHRKYQGVRASAFHKEITGNEVLVFRIEDETLRNNFIQVSSTYAKRVSEQTTLLRNVGEMKHHSSNDYLYLPIPLRGTVASSKNEADKFNAWGLYRNIRAYMRYMGIEKNTGAPQSLSKNWGLECSQFVAYCYIIAQIMTLFPKGLPPSILTLNWKKSNTSILCLYYPST